MKNQINLNFVYFFSFILSIFIVLAVLYPEFLSASMSKIPNNKSLFGLSLRFIVVLTLFATLIASLLMDLYFCFKRNLLHIFLFSPYGSLVWISMSIYQLWHYWRVAFEFNYYSNSYMAIIFIVLVVFPSFILLGVQLKLNIDSLSEGFPDVYNNFKIENIFSKKD